MPSTVPLSRTINLTQQFIRNAPLTFPAQNGNAATNDPAFANADWVRQFIMAPPFSWNWNRVNVIFTCTIGQQDYTASVSSFGWLESATISDPTSGDVTHELEVEGDLSEETVPNQPTRISAQVDDGQGNITFRLIPPPDKEYTVRVSVQGAAPLFASTSETWEPIPDKMSYLYNQGMLAKAYEYLDDTRFGAGMQLFLRQVLAASSGLSETERDIFIRDTIGTQRDGQGSLRENQLGQQSRGMY